MDQNLELHTTAIIRESMGTESSYGEASDNSSEVDILRTHVRVNIKDKSNKCDKCDFASSHVGNLRRHLKTHSGEKSNKCNQCDFASAQAGDLRRHLKTHSGEKSSKCNLLRQGPRLTWVGEPD